MHASPSVLWHTLDKGVSDRPDLQGLDEYWHQGLGAFNSVAFRKQRFLRRAHKVLQLESLYTDVTNTELQATAHELREIFRLRRDQPQDLERAFALVREVAFRLIGERPYLVQVMGAFSLTQGCVAEMATGEGKTLTATMPATVAGLRGAGCHIITVNDYLAQRDAEWMGHIYRFCGLRAAAVEQGMDPGARHHAYQADITYCTNKEVSADFLRDRLALGRIKHADNVLIARITGTAGPGPSRIVQRGLNYAIIDEADSVLIDEAVTPLIISGSAPNTERVDAFGRAASLAGKLDRDVDYNVDQRYRDVELTDQGQQHLAELAEPFGGVWKTSRRSQEIITKALTAKEFYQKDKHYVVEDGKVVIVDDFTGRLMRDRSWRDGLHQAVEAKEGLELTPTKDTYARISFQRFFRLYHRLSGMTGTAREATGEFWQVYGLPVVTIPPNRPCQRKDLADVILPRQDAKWQRILDDIRELHAQGRPVLVGTRSVKSSELISRLLAAENLEHQVLNAVRHQEEAHIIANAGQQGKITVATNMAGRGTDIKLGPQVADRGGLHVISAEKNESARVDRQLLGRCARQGDPGTTRTIVSLEDDLIIRHAGGLTRYARPYTGKADANISSLKTRGLFKIAQHHAQAVSLRQRKNVKKTDHWLDEHLGFAADW